MFNRLSNGMMTRFVSAVQSKAFWLCAVLVTVLSILLTAPVQTVSKGGASIIPEAQASELTPQATDEQPADANPVAIDPMNDADASFSLADVRQQKRLSQWISSKYNVSSENSDLFVTTAYKTAFDLGLDPHLILAIMALESRFNPNARGAGGAKGLMQVVAHIHAKRFVPHGGVQNAMDPVVNIKVGAMILKDMIKRTGSVERAVKAYAGGNGGYNSKVMVQYRKLKAVSGGNVDAFAKPAKNLSRQAG